LGQRAGVDIVNPTPGAVLSAAMVPPDWVKSFPAVAGFTPSLPALIVSVGALMIRLTG
jgi:hypothetical protein